MELKHSYIESKNVDLLPVSQRRMGKKETFIDINQHRLAYVFLRINIIIREQEVLFQLWVSHNILPQQDLLEFVTTLNTNCSSKEMLTFVVY